MDKSILDVKQFLDGAKSVYHAVALLEDMLKKNGYQKLLEMDAWQLKPGGKYYTLRGGSAIIGFQIPYNRPAGFMIGACHSDRPTFKVKENGEITGKYTQLATEKYGGMLIAPWLDRPLSVAGRALVETEQGIESRLVDIDRDLMLIPNVAIHMNRKANEGVAWNPAVDTLPLVGSAEAKGKLWPLIEEQAGGKILGHDLYLYIRQQATVWGVQEEFFSAAALDDLLCAWCCTQGLLAAKAEKAVPVLCVFDSEEVGSSSVQGAASTFLEDVLQRICEGFGWNVKQLLSGSFVVSADNAHAIHPNHPEYSDANNAPVMGQGVALKFNAAQRYTTDGVSAAIFRKVCAAADVPVQTYYNRADLPGGSTLGNISLSHVSVPTADVGIPQLAMHSCFETVAIADIGHMQKVMTCFFGAAMDGEYSVQTNW